MKQYLRHMSAGRELVTRDLLTGLQLTALSNLWEFDSYDGRVLASIQVAYGPIVHVAIAVRNERERRRQHQEFAIWSVSSSGDVWMVEHGVYDAHLDQPHPLLPPMSLCLTHAPEDIARALARL